LQRLIYNFYHSEVRIWNLNPGFWRIDVYPEDVVECVNRADNCIGGSDGDYCASGISIKVSLK
jgi:hypothetical protein